MDQLIDRGKTPINFIMRGKTEGSVEITIKQPVGSLSIKRVIKTTGNVADCSSWYIDGKSSTEKQVKEVVKKNQIKIDNMCHFLPQEKVKEFANLAKNPKAMLTALQDAIGEGWMNELHEELKDMQKKESSVQNELEAQNKRIAMLQGKEEELEQEIHRFHQIAKLQGEIKIRKQKVPWIQVLLFEFYIQKLFSCTKSRSRTHVHRPAGSRCICIS